jgi:hypothetical protein
MFFEKYSLPAEEKQQLRFSSPETWGENAKPIKRCNKLNARVACKREPQK